MKPFRFQSLGFASEIVAAYGLLFYIHSQGIISLTLFFLLMTFIGLMFALYYGVKGSAAAAVGSGVLLFLNVGASPVVFLSRHYVEATFYLAALLITGYAKTLIERKAISGDLTNTILTKRVERLTVDLSERDRAIQDAFYNVLTDMESPKIMYQALRRLDREVDRETFFEEILYILYTHCHIEKAGIYSLVHGQGFKRISVFGATNLPESLAWKSEDIPEILRVAQAEKEVIIPKEVSNRFVMAIPILSSLDKLLYIILIEEIRFINLSENLINLLKVVAFWIKSMIEDRLSRDDRVSLSAFSSIIVYKPEVAGRLLKENIARYKKYRLPFSMLRSSGPISEENARKLSSNLRLYDELFMLQEDELVIFLSMTVKENVSYVLERIKRAIPDLDITVVEKG